MFDDSLRRRLELLNREPLPGQAVKAAVTPTGRQRRIAPPKSAAAPNGAARQFPGLLRRGECVDTPAGEHWRIRLPLEALWQEGPKLVAARQEFLRSQLAAARDAIEPRAVIDADFASFVAALPDRAIMLDLETCGLTGAALFLVGLLRQIDGVATVELLLARNFAEEAAVLESLWQTVASHDVLVTFNGKTFDWPMVIERSIRHRLRPLGWAQNVAKSPPVPSSLPGNSHAAKVHLDVLHHARRRWRKRLPNCRLQTLETHVCRRRRPPDIPGHAIPGVYADYVRTGVERDMDIVLYHNAIDLVTLFDLALRLAA
jgi:uncharacterized protein YprB with RNaseH-like and TPR domain